MSERARRPRTIFMSCGRGDLARYSCPAGGETPHDIHVLRARRPRTIFMSCGRGDLAPTKCNVRGAMNCATTNAFFVEALVIQMLRVMLGAACDWKRSQKYLPCWLALVSPRYTQSPMQCDVCVSVMIW